MDQITLASLAAPLLTTAASSSPYFMSRYPSANSASFPHAHREIQTLLSLFIHPLRSSLRSPHFSLWASLASSDCMMNSQVVLGLSSLGESQ
jgi:hypothetical protein